MRAPRVFLHPEGIGSGGGGGTSSPIAAPFGNSLFNAASKQQSSQQSPSSSSFIRHYDRMVVRMEEIFDDTSSHDGTASVVIGPACTDRKSASVGTSSHNKMRCWSIPFARAANQPSLLSTTCPAVSLAQHNWYDNHKPRKPHVQLGVVAAVSDPTGRILLTRRAAHMRSFPHAWVMPGGGLDDGETLEQCLVREVREETGVEVDPSSVVPFCLWESCYPTCGEDCITAGTGITAHYLVVFCLARTAEQQDVSRQQVKLDEQETDLAIWLSADDFARTLDHPLGGIDLGSVSSAASSSKVPLEQLCGIYPRGDAMVGIAQGNLFMLEELLQSKGGNSFQ